jgi:hypothetical protein
MRTKTVSSFDNERYTFVMYIGYNYIYAHTHTLTYIYGIHTHRRTLTYIYGIHTHRRTLTYIYGIHTHTHTLTYIYGIHTHTDAHEYTTCSAFLLLQTQCRRYSAKLTPLINSCCAILELNVISTFNLNGERITSLRP